MGDLLAAIGVTITRRPPPGRLELINTGNIVPGGAVRAGRADPRLDQRARPAARPAAGTSACRCPAATTSAPARSTCTCRASRRWAPRSSSATGTSRRSPTGSTAPTSSFDFPSVGATENIAHGRRAGQGRHRHRQRGPRARDRRPVRVPRGDGREHLGDRHVDTRRRRRRAGAAAGGATTTRPRPDPGRHLHRRGRRGRRRIADDRGRAPRAHGDAARPVRRHGPRRSPASTADAGARPPSGCARSTWRRCRTPASPPTTSRCIVTMLAVADGVGIVTENLYPGRFRYVEELQRLGADIRTERPPRGGAWRPAAVGRAGAGPRHPRRRGAGGRRACRRGRDRRSPACTTSTVATTTSSVVCKASAPRSSGCPPRADLRVGYGWWCPAAPIRRLNGALFRSRPRPLLPPPPARRAVGEVNRPAISTIGPATSSISSQPP